MFELFRQPDAFASIGALDRDAEAQDHASDRGVNSGTEDEDPGDDAQRQQDDPGAPSMLGEELAKVAGQDGKQDDRNQRETQVGQLELIGEDHSNDHNGDQIVHDRQRQQEDAQRRRQC